MELRIVFNHLRRWIWLLLIGLVLGAGAGYFAAQYQTPIYQASSKVMVLKAPDSAVSNVTNISDQELIQTYIQLLTTQPVLDEASRILGFRVARGQIQGNQVGGTKLLQITVVDPQPERAEQIANQIVQVLIEQNELLQASLYSSSEESLQVQIAQIEAQITTLQTDISERSQESIEIETQQLEAEQQALQETIFNLQRDIAELELEIEALIPTAPAFGEIVPTLTPSGRYRVSALRTELAQKQFNLDLARQSYFALVLPDTSAGNNQEQVRQSQQQATLVLYQQIYSTLLGNYEAVRLARLQNTANVVQVEPATTPTRAVPLSPLWAIGAAAGLIVAAGIAFLVEFLDVSLKTADDIERVLRLPVIGYVAETSELEHQLDQPYTARAPHSPVAESFRNLRVNLDFAGKEKPLQSLLVTSPGSAEGKTTLVSNLAVLMANSGLQVLLIDADLRRPLLHKTFNLPNMMGLSSLLLNEELVAGEAAFKHYTKDILQPTTVDRLMVLTSGPIPPNPSELLGSNRMAHLLHYAEKIADIVLVDSPPLLVADASVLANRVDGVIFIIEPGKTKADSALTMMQQLHRAGARVVGAVLNRISKRSIGFEEAYRYYDIAALQAQEAESARQQPNGHAAQANGRWSQLRAKVQERSPGGS